MGEPGVARVPGSQLRLSKVSLLLALVAYSFPASAQQQEATVELGKPAVSVVRPRPFYPGNELRSGTQGWVELSFVVDVDGSVVDPVVVDSSGSRSFERAALDSVNKWSYEPATWNGEPVQQCETRTLITFAIEGERTTVSPTFRNRYIQIKNAIDDGELERAGEMVARVRRNLNLTLADNAWLSSLEVRIAGQTGDRDAQLDAVRAATQGGGRWIDERLFPNLLYVRTALELEKGNYAHSLSTFETLVEVDPESELIARLEPHIQTVRKNIESDTTLQVNGEIDGGRECLDCDTRWHHKPVRRTFALTNVDGELGNMEFRCQRRRVRVAAEEGLTWQLPESYGSCSIVVHGEPGTSFSLLELPKA